MSPELIFTIASRFAIVGWILLAAIPNQKITKISVRSGAWSAALSLLYLIVLAFNFGGEGNFQSLQGVALLFSNPWVLLAGWVHYLAFDLFLGVWETKEAEALGISRWILVPCLFLTLMFGPVGYLLFQVIRWIKGGDRASI
ncbi:DUF4281 domain-containing protein [Leptospira langatensis]|uniref:DUF4281 domain-containing protein n=1 Tax=Leptospira langatensis TaxID=2484983 RepID=A0A5F1ZU59_9LEPT|nr:ABA4-like family protein [Leptospira langatensis]TGK03040.1 DUF4281 domain-containing protein [Leptospira langatensis]TGL41796.1 DUF4281 domain-containing protein [Leptospira langatensis]